MNTSSSGTNVTDIQWGIEQYLNNTGYAADYNETTVLWPEFNWIEEEVERCEDVVLLLGFYHNYTGYYERFGGHYVTVAGVNSNTSQLSISDPYFDSVGNATPGVHNDTQYVSHDIYNVTNIFPNNMSPCWALPDYAGGKNVTNFIGQNGGPSLPPGAYNQGLPVVTVIDYAVAVSPSTATLEGNVSFYRAAGPGDPTWETPLVVSFFDNATQNETAWSPINVTTDAYGNFTVDGIAVGTYDIGIKNYTTHSKMVYGKAFIAGNTTKASFGTLIEADCDDNDKTDGADYAKVLNNYNVRKVADPTFWNTNALWKADYTRDDKIDGSDYASVLNNYNGRGDIFYYTH